MSSDGPASPTLCGTNSGHHIIVEADDDCNEVIDEDIIKCLLKLFFLDFIHMGQWSESARVEHSGETVYDWSQIIFIVR